MSYDSWPKEKLISKIRKLEQALEAYEPAKTKTASNAEPLPNQQVTDQKATDSQITEQQGSSHQNPSDQTIAKKKKKEFDFSKFSTRKVAIRFAYLGWNYSGLAVQNDPEILTVEGRILAALHKTKLIPSEDPNDCDFSRCGRTDKGVSAFRQVISLRVRSQLSPEEQQDPANDTKEVDYLHILNQLLPDDIRLYEICLRPGEEFDARFSCTFRHYKYFFHNSSANPSGPLDINKMQNAAQMFLGEHDFRNFCKVDGSKQIKNFKREVLASSIIPVGAPQNGMYCFDLKGTAFLWHQVRSMVAILFLVGQGLEKPEMVQQLLNAECMPRRPVYEMAADIPLVLYDCGFPPELEWKSFKFQDSATRLEDRVYGLWHEYWMRSSMAAFMMDSVTQNVHAAYGEDGNTNKPTHRVVMNLGDGQGKTQTKYVELKNRTTLEPPEVINARWLKRKGRDS